MSSNLEKIETAFKNAGMESARFEARQLYNHIKENNLEDRLDELVLRRLWGEPLQYIIGEWEFYSLPFYVGRGVLIPRPDTETLCDKAIEFIGDKPLSVADLCSGSGCVAIAVAEHCKNAAVTAVEKSKKAYAYLEKNIVRNRSRVIAHNADIFSVDSGKFDVILSNPPYIPNEDCKTLQREVMFEPKMALAGGADGLSFYRKIAKHWVPRLNKGGLLAVEVGIGQSEAVAEIFSAAGLSNVGTKRDLSGIERVVFGTLDSL